MSITLFKRCQLVGLLALLPGLALAEPVFTPIDSNLGNSQSVAIGISNDGSTVVGQAYYYDPTDGTSWTEGLKWTETSGGSTFTACPDLIYNPTGTHTSADGSVIAGYCEYMDDLTGLFINHAVRWDPSGAPTRLWTGFIGGISADGQIVVGTEDSRDPLIPSIQILKATRWNATTGESEYLLPDGTESVASDISDDGSIIVGIEFYDLTPTPPYEGLFIIENGVKTTLPFPSPTVEYFGADPVISGDGSTVYAMYQDINGSSIARWSASMGWTQIFSGSTWVNLEVTDTNFDGSVFVGTYYDYNSTNEGAVIWDNTNGLRILKDVMLSWGLPVKDWFFDRATGISNDGTMISGYGSSTNGTNPGGLHGWFTRLSGTPLPPPPNEAPVANDDAYSVSEDTTLVTNAGSGVLANDSDLDGEPLTASLVRSPNNGILNLFADGSFSYEPAPDFSGSDSFTYVASDGIDDSAPATVTITITAVNDAPTACFAASDPVYKRADVSFDASCASDIDGTITSYSWNFGDGNTLITTIDNTVHSYKRTGTYTVTMTATDNNGASSTSTAIIDVISAPKGGGKPK